MFSRDSLLKWGYALVFCVFLPSLLILWARLTEDLVGLSVPYPPEIGGAVAIVSGALMLWSMLALRIHGGGLPMNAFPPAEYVARGPYFLFSHPIYVGFAGVVAGLSIFFQSGSGLYLVSPVVIAGEIALVLGYEAEAITKLFSNKVRPAFIHVPSRENAQATGSDAVSAILLALPSYLLITELQLRDNWTWPVALLSFVPALVLVILVRQAKTSLALRRLLQEIWILLTFNVLSSLVFPRVSFLQISIWSWIFFTLGSRRGIHAYIAKGLGFVGVLAGVRVGIPFVTFFVASSIGMIAAYGYQIWSYLLRTAELIANSWRHWTIGRMRIINHGAYTGLASAVAIAIMALVVEPKFRVLLLLNALIVLLGAGLWAQMLEGSSRLARPFGYYGGIFAGIALSPLTVLFGLSPWYILAGFGLSGPWLQAIGRLRCLVQGCCHGAPVEAGRGIVYSHPMSRVVRISELAGIPLHATQLYSTVWNILTGAIVTSLWLHDFRASFIAGMYLVFNGVGRFVEESRRGEPQTAMLWGMRFYQWLAVFTVVLGIAFTCVPGSPALPSQPLDAGTVSLAIAFGLLVWFAQGVDFPESQRRFARLT